MAIILIKKDKKKIKVKTDYVTKKEQIVVKIREDLIEIYDDMDEWERQRLRLDYLELQQCRCEKYKDKLLNAIVKNKYSKQVEILSHLFIQYLDRNEFQYFVTFIDTKKKLDRFFEIFEKSEIEYVRNVKDVILQVFHEQREAVC